MGKKNNPIIAVLFGDTYTEYAENLIKGFCACAKAEKVNLVFLMRSSLPQDTNATLSGMTGEDFQVHFSSIYDYVPLFHPDALIIAYGSLSVFSDAPEMEVLLDFYKDIPCTLIKATSNDGRVPHLVTDNYGGMCACMEHLIVDHGYRKIGFLSGPKKHHEAKERLRAYFDMMKKYNLPVEESMVEYGGFSDIVEEQVNRLLDQNEGLEAIAFANDKMAASGYRVCEQRGMSVGKDLAITGFDDVDMATTLHPQMTSVMHNSFLLSYQALMNAICIANGKCAKYQTLQAVLQKRFSCGCDFEFHEKEKRCIDYNNSDFLKDIVKKVFNEKFSYIPYEKEKKYHEDLILSFFNEYYQYGVENKISEYTESVQFKSLRRLCEAARISAVDILVCIMHILHETVSYLSDEQFVQLTIRVLERTQQFIYIYTISEMNQKNQVDHQQKWFADAFTQDLLLPNVTVESGLLLIMKRFRMMGIGNCYFVLFSNPEERDCSYQLEIPKNLYLTAYCEGDEFVSLKKTEWIPISEEYGVEKIISDDVIHTYTTQVLFSGNTQYGFMICECKPQDVHFILESSLNIGSFLRVAILNESEQSAKRELQRSMELIKEQNSILNSLSKEDQLTKLLNRRGFMESAIHMVNANIGKAAYILLGDLDHLKEINDTFGHSEGDFALISITHIMKSCFPEDAVIGRIGGDEFAAIIVTDEPDYEVAITERIKKFTTSFNEACDKPYYVELSFGICSCICDRNTEITGLLQQSDKFMYQGKIYRRSSILK